ncbi:MAG: hypothetical protein CHACPFDD_02558 [Phycisphaerae bacterium]|nr:hypothetical protein [Phycisphaerae bacterium]
MRYRICVIALLGFTAATALAQFDQVVIDLTGVQLKNGTNQSRSSAPNALNAGFAYAYDISALVEGQSGLMALLYPDPVDLGEVLDSFQPGASELLTGEVYNPSGTHPFETLSQRFEGTGVISGINVFVGVTVSAGLNASGIAYFDLTDVVITPSLIVGSMVVTSGTATFDRIPVITGDMNYDGSVNGFDVDPFVQALSDPAGYVTAFGHDPRFAGDVNRDGTFNGFDIDPFVDLLAP